MNTQINWFEATGEEAFKQEKSNDWKWSFKDYPRSNGLKVFSCFAGGGGSTMGYKLAGFEVIGCCEIDPKMNAAYVRNHKPKYNYLMDIREFNQQSELPSELYNLDILDGSPPCTSFSMAGDREKSWGKQKKFREGQKEQTLDDLVFVFIETVAKLKPKCVIIENVEGLIRGKAWGYVQRIYSGFKSIGYKVKHWLLKGENMGVPQTRHRVVFVAIRQDIDFDPSKLDMSFNCEEITYGKIREGKGRQATKLTQALLKMAIPGDISLENVKIRLGQKPSRFNEVFVWSNQVLPTITAKGTVYYPPGMSFISNEEIISASTFPRDYDFINTTPSNIGYICGMSVPPVMIKRVAVRVLETIFGEML